MNAFLAEDDGLACVQAALTIDNTADSLLTRLFTAEYASQFGWACLRGWAVCKAATAPDPPAPFRMPDDLLPEGWDPYNVTEDADLGIRLARRGYRTGTVSSTTCEEAPKKLQPWIRQRTRWFKGWVRPVNNNCYIVTSMSYRMFDSRH